MKAKNIFGWILVAASAVLFFLFFYLKQSLFFVAAIVLLILGLSLSSRHSQKTTNLEVPAMKRENLVRKLKVTGYAILAVGIILSLAVGLSLNAADTLDKNANAWWWVTVGGSLISYAFCLVLRGFARLIDNSDMLMDLTYHLVYPQSKEKAEENEEE